MTIVLNIALALFLWPMAALAGLIVALILFCLGMRLGDFIFSFFQPRSKSPDR